GRRPEHGPPPLAGGGVPRAGARALRGHRAQARSGAGLPGARLGLPGRRCRAAAVTHRLPARTAEQRDHRALEGAGRRTRAARTLRRTRGPALRPALPPLAESPLLATLRLTPRR